MADIFTYIVMVLLLIIIILMEIKIRHMEKFVVRMQSMVLFLSTDYIKRNKKRLTKKFPKDMIELSDIIDKYGL